MKISVTNQILSKVILYQGCKVHCDDMRASIVVVTILLPSLSSDLISDSLKGGVLDLVAPGSMNNKIYDDSKFS